ncbi:MAG: hypothetical protein A3I78_05795, partial [Gammaproteobacteria bacterium RIFCSPLOWO2_02_FULL_56_15]
MKPPASIDSLIFTIRGYKVMLDADLARLYGVTTKRFNEAFKRNHQRFPDDFAFQLAAVEFKDLRSQIATSSLHPTDNPEDIPYQPKFATSSHGGPRYRPWAFTEHGALMAANILRSDQAVHMSVYVVRAFIQMREQIAANAAILKRLAEFDKSLLQHDTALRDIYQKLLPLLQPPPVPSKRGIGF